MCEKTPDECPPMPTAPTSPMATTRDFLVWLEDPAAHEVPWFDLPAVKPEPVRTVAPTSLQTHPDDALLKAEWTVATMTRWSLEHMDRYMAVLKRQDGGIPPEKLKLLKRIRRKIANREAAHRTRRRKKEIENAQNHLIARYRIELAMLRREVCDLRTAVDRLQDPGRSLICDEMLTV